MKKTTQNVTKSIALSGLLAFVFLFSLSINSQTVGQEFLVNPGVNSATGANSTTADTGVDGSGNMPANLGGWTGGAGGAYAPTSVANGDCHSEDRMFKFNKVGGSAGHYVYQDVVNLPAGNFNWSFYTRWGAVVDYDAGDAKKPTFTISTDDDADGTWEVVETIITTQPTAANTWVEQTGAFENDSYRQVRIKFSKSGGTTAEPTNLQELMYIDDVSLIFASTLSVSEEELMSFSIYPNPATDLISISGVDNIKSIKVYSILGSLEKEVFNTNQIDISELSSGIHLIKVDNGTVSIKKIIKQ